MPEGNQDMIQAVNRQPIVRCMSPNGLGFGDGHISVNKRIKSGGLHSEAVRIAHDIIMNHPAVFAAVDEDANDDGCGDGRPTARIFRLIETAAGSVKTYFNTSRKRAKVFGGGLVTASGMWRSVAGPPNKGETILGDRRFIAEELRKHGIEFGAHTDSSAVGDISGCGAIDNYADIMQHVVRYETQIADVLRAMYREEYQENEASITTVLARYRAMSEYQQYFSNDSGVDTIDLILKSGAVIKELVNNHQEVFIILNDVDGTTFDQSLFNEQLKRAGVSDTIQAFVVDTWRGRMYANAIATIAREYLSGSDLDSAQREAYADFLIRTVAVSATLTQNDLPIYERLTV